MLAEPRMGFNGVGNLSHIIQVNLAGAPEGFERQFWQTFRMIASNPVGRVLLYRLLIEIRRMENHRKFGLFEGGIKTVNRNELRSIEIKYANMEDFSFDEEDKCINFDPSDTTINTMTFDPTNQKVATALDGQDDTLDIGLFHEMLQWFHCLRYPSVMMKVILKILLFIDIRHLAKVERKYDTQLNIYAA